jgi:transposase
MAGKRPKTKKMEDRDRQIALEMMADVRPADVARKYGVSKRTVSRAVERYEARRPSLAEHDPEAFIKERLLQFDQAIEDLAIIGIEAPSDKDRAAAISAKVRVTTQRDAFVLKVGILRPLDVDQGIRHEVLGEFVQWSRVLGPEAFDAFRHYAEKFLEEQDRQ